MIQWEYKAEDYGRKRTLKPGQYRVRIENAEETTSKKGFDMIKLTLKVSGEKVTLYYYIVFFPDNPQMTNEKLGGVYDSFNIEPGNLDAASWIGKAGAADIINKEDQNGIKQNEIRFFISRAKQYALPEWSEDGTGTVNAEMIDPNKIPF